MRDTQKKRIQVITSSLDIDENNDDDDENYVK